MCEENKTFRCKSNSRISSETMILGLFTIQMAKEIELDLVTQMRVFEELICVKRNHFHNAVTVRSTISSSLILISVL